MADYLDREIIKVLDFLDGRIEHIAEKHGIYTSAFKVAISVDYQPDGQREISYRLTCYTSAANPEVVFTQGSLHEATHELDRRIDFAFRHLHQLQAAE